MNSDENRSAGAPDSLLRRVKSMLTPWYNRTRKAEQADAEADEVIATADQVHVAARSAIRDAFDATRASYRAADERIRRIR